MSNIPNHDLSRAVDEPPVIEIPSIGPRVLCPHCGYLAASDGNKTTFCVNCGRSIKNK